VINHDIGYLHRIEDCVFLDGIFDLVRGFAARGYRPVVVTNQSGIGRGLFDFSTLNAIHDKMHRQLASAGGRIDAIFYCPHTADSACDCRKPKPGLIERAARDFDIDLTRSWMIGDRYGDVQLARNAGVRSAFVLSGYGRGEWEYQRAGWQHQPDLIAEDLLAAVREIIK
jgi:histidinol-phosphate phosphatase family protein